MSAKKRELETEHPVERFQVRFRTPYKDPYPEEKGHIPFAVEGSDGPNGIKTKQSFKDECDINNIVRKFDEGFPMPIQQAWEEGDFVDAPTFQESMELVVYAREQFDSLPARIRDKFANDPRRFFEFTQNPDNVEEMAALGMLTEESVQKIQKRREDEYAKKHERKAPEEEPKKGS